MHCYPETIRGSYADGKRLKKSGEDEHCYAQPDPTPSGGLILSQASAIAQLSTHDRNLAAGKDGWSLCDRTTLSAAAQPEQLPGRRGIVQL
jgi:hypothetical protein